MTSAESYQLHCAKLEKRIERFEAVRGMLVSVIRNADVSSLTLFDVYSSPAYIALPEYEKEWLAGMVYGLKAN